MPGLDFNGKENTVAVSIRIPESQGDQFVIHRSAFIQHCHGNRRGVDDVNMSVRKHPRDILPAQDNAGDEQYYRRERGNNPGGISSLRAAFLFRLHVQLVKGIDDRLPEIFIRLSQCFSEIFITFHCLPAPPRSGCPADEPGPA